MNTKSEISDATWCRELNGWVLSDARCSWVIQPKFQGEADFSEGLAVVKVNERFGYFNKTGKFEFKLRFDDEEYFEGLAAFRLGEKWGFLDSKGSIIIPPQFDEANGFSCGRAWIKEGNLWGAIDSKGNLVVPFKYRRVKDFSDEFALVAIDFSRKHTLPDEEYWAVRKIPGFASEFQRNGKIEVLWGVIHVSGKVVVMPSYVFIDNFECGVARVLDPAGEFFLIDSTGRHLNYHGYKRLGNFVEDLAPFERRSNENLSKKLAGFLDRSGKEIISPKEDSKFFFEAVQPFQEGLAPVKIGGKWGYIDPGGMPIVQPTFEYAGPFSDGLAKIQLHGQFGFIDKTGKIVVEPTFTCASNLQKFESPAHSGSRKGFYYVAIQEYSCFYTKKYVLTGKILSDGSLTDVKETTQCGAFFLPLDNSPTGTFHHWPLVLASELVFHFLIAGILPKSMTLFFHTLGVMLLFLYYAAKCLQLSQKDLWITDAGGDSQYFESSSDLGEVYSAEND